jgi:hypothetical protein
VLAHQVEEVEQRALVGDAGVQVLDQHRAVRRRAPHVSLAERARLQPRRPGLEAPHAGQMRLAGVRRRHHGHRRLRPVGPQVDHVGRDLVGGADEEVVRAESGAVRQVEDELLGAGAHSTGPLVPEPVMCRTHSCR